MRTARSTSPGTSRPSTGSTQSRPSTIRDRQKLVDYQKSMQIPTRPVPDDVELPFVTHARVSIFLATT